MTLTIDTTISGPVLLPAQVGGKRGHLNRLMGLLIGLLHLVSPACYLRGTTERVAWTGHIFGGIFKTRRPDPSRSTAYHKNASLKHDIM